MTFFKKWRNIAVLVLCVSAIGALFVHSSRRLLVDDARVVADMITLAAAVEGRVADIAVKERQAIARGDVLVRIDSQAARLAVEGIEKDLAMARIEIERLERHLALQTRTAVLDVKSARSSLHAAHTRAALTAQQRTLSRAETERARHLTASGFLSAGGLGRYQNEAIKAQLDGAQAAQVLDAAGEQTARALLAQQNVALGRLDLQTAKTKLERNAIARLALLDSLQKHDIKSPGTGIVDKIFVHAGEFVMVGKRVMLIHDPSTIHIRANVKEKDLGKVATAQTVAIRFDGCSDDTARGVVTDIGSTTNSEFTVLPAIVPGGSFVKVAQSIPIKIAITDTRCAVRPGMQAEVEFRR
ncbi:efflux RND transporter periplasmic adaptor subunit [Massilia sp. PAMC28688]|uniref:HlyD family secretion protein n=1 Tax=Massilia sp. PAMC28688 TaxID=2861283 RepID=UPI001C62A806|nr:HlyD family efflux transporter periplasmic adaptor subunit [Massilia sp. PAMC28688]QYF94329.1 efflux RND transporter periplasmic adaptor subunit [Massilia sp. PAMC28688]